MGLAHDRRFDLRKGEPMAEHEIHRRRRGRNYAVGGALLLLAILTFAVTVVKLGAMGGGS